MAPELSDKRATGAKSPDDEAFCIRIVRRVTELTSRPYCDSVAA